MLYLLATGNLWIFGNCADIDIKNCQIQFSSHHGFDIHSSKSNIARNVNLTGVRALYSGCGQLRGQGSQINTAKSMLPELDGHGYYDWSVGFDLCEAQNVIDLTATDCFAYESWKAGFYTEPFMTGGPITNMKLIRCRAENSGQRGMLPGTSLTVGNNPSEDSGTTIFKEGEGANFYVQGGYFEDCVSVNGLKAGWYITTEGREGANGYTDKGRAHLVNCGDMGSPISLVTEMYDCPGVYTDGFFSLNAKNFAMWIFAGKNNHYKDTVILSLPDQVNEPIKIGYMLRTQLRFSRDSNNKKQTSSGGKYDLLRGSFTSSSISGTIYGLPTSVSSAEIVSGASFNGKTDPNAAGSNIALTRNNSTTIKVSDYVK